MASLTLRGAEKNTSVNTPEETDKSEQPEEPYRYAALLPVFSNDRYPPLEPFQHVDPGHRALAHPNPRSFLDSATSVVELTPNLGTEVHGLNLASLTSDERDQVALEVANFIASGDGTLAGKSIPLRSLLFVLSSQQMCNFFNQHSLHIHPTSGHPEGFPEIHLVYRDANSSLNFEVDDSITSTVWHTDVSYELQPPGLTTLFLLAQPRTGGDTLFTSQVSTLKKLSPAFVAFLKTLKAVHSGVEQAEFSRSGRRGGVVRREPVEHVHPIVRRHPVTGEEALYVNRQFTRRIVGLKKEESENILNFLYDHITKAGDLQARLHWTPNTVVLWDNRVTAHSAVADYGKDMSKERRHGARITPQAERPIPAWEGLEL
ncbi:hypothetical protein EW145_g5291 [Phellinidium pouzarii]|uniref:TauD/TfdA-like domain-containing protein n=1 Tax=Phellinidium pouzarii TaxID=167371 RepID=A0A4S4L5A0_9AGAM|nr:hypothetical protein EW145_g5291 [Phellinidium pouzarii]